MAEFVSQIPGGSFKSLARAISLTENKVGNYKEILLNLPPSTNTSVIGVTGPPGAGKSTLVDALIAKMVLENKKVGVLCIDPSSPFNRGALLGDRIRMSQWYNNANVFIRSLSNRGSLGGLNPLAIEISDLMKSAGFDYIIVETVGVGQSEVDIAGLADVTVIVLVPESGDEVQAMKAGLMEIGDIFVVNKADRPDADTFTKTLRHLLSYSQYAEAAEIPVFKTVASAQQGVDVLFENIIKQCKFNKKSDKHYWLLAEKAFQLLITERMSDVNKDYLYQKIKLGMESEKTFNLYKFIEDLK